MKRMMLAACAPILRVARLIHNFNEWLFEKFDTWFPVGHQTITEGEISPNGGPMDVEM